jgi:hypothetical protein
MRLIVTKATEQLVPQWEWLLETLKDYVEANPDATKPDASTYIAGLTSPFDLATLQIVDRVGALQWLITEIGASWAEVKNFLINNPVDMLKKFEKGQGLDLDTTGDKAKITKLVGDSFDREGWEEVTWPADAVVEITREKSPGPTFNFITKKVWQGTIDGKAVTVQQIFTNELVDKRVVITAGDFEVV